MASPDDYDKVVEAKGGLHNRVHFASLRLMPFNLNSETEDYLRSRVYTGLLRYTAVVCL